MKLIIISFILLLGINLSAQDIYKTPSGSKYHLATCRTVKNVSTKLNGQSDVTKYGLQPCKICKPLLLNNLASGNSLSDKAVGIASAVRCVGKTKKGARCQHMTKLANGYCFQHTKQNSDTF